MTLKTLKSSPDTKNLPFPDLGCRYHHLKNLKPDKWGNKSWRVIYPEKGSRALLSIKHKNSISQKSILIGNIGQMHRLWTLSKVIIKLQFKQIIIAEIKLDICIGYKPFISKAVGNVFIEIAYQLIELNQKGYHWQNLGTILRNVIACEFWCAYRLRGFARSTTPGAWNVDALICNQHGTEILEIHKCSTTLWRISKSGNKIPIRGITAQKCIS